jgi:hypothetical protein
MILAPAKVSFDLSRSIDLHLESAKNTHEKVMAGRSRGLIECGEFVIWQARHFMITQTMSVKISEFHTNPFFFRDEMIAGPFVSMRHEHFFSESGTQTFMKDQFFYEVPFGFIGHLFNRFLLKRHLTRLLTKRNAMIKTVAENGANKKFVGSS